MKRQFIVLLAIISMAFCVSAQETTSVKNTSHKRGYKFNAELGLGIKEQMYFSTSHGYNFGNGLFVGGGASFMAEWGENYFEGDPNMITPVYGEIKYTPFNTLVSPYIDFRTGAAIDITNKKVRMMIAPSIGIDLACVSLGIGYTWHTINLPWNGLNISASINF